MKDFAAIFAGGYPHRRTAWRPISVAKIEPHDYQDRVNSEVSEKRHSDSQ